MTADLDLEPIRARIADCLTYNFGMVSADCLAHEDAPALLAEVERLRGVVSQAKAEALQEAAERIYADPMLRTASDYLRAEATRIEKKAGL